MRTDIHKPSSIVPNDYSFVGFKYEGPSEIGFELVEEYTELIESHEKKTGGQLSDHNHGGTCHVCGASAFYLGVFYHQQTNTYIQVGGDCASKLSLGEKTAFRNFSDRVKHSAEFVTGKKLARTILEEKDLLKCWEVFEARKGEEPNQESIIISVVFGLVQYGKLTDKQENFLKKLLDQIEERPLREQAERERLESAADCPEGRTTVQGEVISVKWQDNEYGGNLKMLVQHSSGYRVWGTVPSSLQGLLMAGKDGVETRDVQKGDQIEFTATLKSSDKDKKFGFFSRPTKGFLVS